MLGYNGHWNGRLQAATDEGRREHLRRLCGRVPGNSAVGTRSRLIRVSRSDGAVPGVTCGSPVAVDAAYGSASLPAASAARPKSFRGCA
jgi:hypothetical protein